MTGSTISSFEFHGNDLVIQVGDSPATTMVAIKPVVHGMGLNWETQYRKLRHHPVLNKGMVIMTIPSAGGPQAMTALPLNRLNLWLATINPNKVPDVETRARIIRYQEEAADALFDHFFGRARFTDASDSEFVEDAADAVSPPDWEEWNRWIALIDVARRVHGRMGAKQLWQASPLPQLTPIGVTFQPSGADAEARMLVETFLEEATERRPGCRTAAVNVINAFNHWARVNGHPSMSKTTFGRMLTALGVQRQRAGCMWYLDIALPAGSTGGRGHLRSVPR